MPRIHIETWIAAPASRCFDLMRDVDVHTRSTGQTGERAVGGVTHGLLNYGDEVTWEGKHLGVRQRLTVRVTRCEPPDVFVDVMVRGTFASFKHTHTFCRAGGGTWMIDDFNYRSPLGVLGRIAEVMFLERYMQRFLKERAAFLKAEAERLDAI